jgi:putative membrane protein
MPITCTLAAAVLAAWPMATAQGQDTTYSPWRSSGTYSPETQGSRTVTSALDTSYIRTMVRSNLTEVALGRLATSRASAPQVKDFANRMITDHDNMVQPWSKLASSYKLKMPTFGVDLGEAGKEASDRLGKLKGTEFDQAYMTEMINEHEQDLQQLQQIRSSAQDPQIRQLASDGESTISQHLQLAQQVGSQVGVATTAGRVGGVTHPTTTNPTTTNPNGTYYPNGTYRRPNTTSTNNTNPVATERNNNGNLRLSERDRRFVDDVLGDHLLHQRLARLAERNATRNETREFARDVEKEMSSWADRWSGFAERRNADVTSKLERQDRNKIQRLQDVKDRNFDQAYAHIVANHTQQMLDDFRNQRWDRRSDVAGRLAQKEIPVLRDLHQRASQLERQIDNAVDNSGKKSNNK